LAFSHRTLLVTLLAACCCCEGGRPPDGVYLAGTVVTGFNGDSYVSSAAMWMNGAEVTIDCSSGARVHDITVTETSVVIAGSLNSRPVYWQDGDEVALNDDMEPISVAAAVTAAGDDLYVAGLDATRRALYWVNGERKVLSSRGSTWEIAVAEGEVYVVGDEVDVRLDEFGFESYYNRRTGYWAGSERVTLWQQAGSGPLSEPVEGDGSEVQLHGIAVDDGRVFVAGDRVLDDDHTATLWEDGEERVLQEDATAVAIAAGDGVVAIAGTHQGEAMYWQDGDAIPLPPAEGASSTAAHDVAISRGDVYVLGTEFRSGSSTRVLWKNGSRVEDFTDGSPYAIFVK